MEIYKDIIGYEKLYKISDMGNIVNSKGQLRKTVVTPFGYKRVCLCKNNKPVSHHVHKLVALTFIPNPENKPCINHINSIKTDNSVSNLEWCTHKENTKHMYQSKPTKKGMTLDRANEIRKLYRSKNYKQIELAKAFEISRPMISGIVNNYYWN